MKEEKFLKKLRKMMPDLVYSDSLLDSESIEIPIYFCLDDKDNVKIDFEVMREEFNQKLKRISLEFKQEENY